MKRTLIEIISGIILIIVFVGVLFFIDVRFKKEKNDLIIAKNKEYAQSVIEFVKVVKKEKENYQKELEKIKTRVKVITKVELKEIPCENKDEIILGLQDDKIKLITLFDPVFRGWTNTIIELENLNTKFTKTNNMLKDYMKTNQISLYTMAGIGGFKDYANTNKLNFVLIVGIDYTKYFLLFNNNFGLTTGGWVQVYEDIVIGAKLGIDIKIK